MTDEILRYVRDQALNPQWEKAGRVHDWRNHVGLRTQAIWHTFTDEQKIALAADADGRASSEHWD